MPQLNHLQSSAADSRRSASQGHLVITSAPSAARALIGKSLIGAGLIDDPGVYVCEFATHDWTTVEVVLMASAVTGTIAPQLDRMYFGGKAVRNSDTGVDFVAATPQTLTLADLKGSQVARVVFTVGAGEDVVFDRGADETAPTALAEFNGQ